FTRVVFLTNNREFFVRQKFKSDKVKAIIKRLAQFDRDVPLETLNIQ
ncbi:MAG: hypothetical protein ACI9A8_000613, partial [Cryomorphaceae bacterium]